MLVKHEGHCLAVNHGTFDGKAMVGGDNLANYDAAMAGDAARLARRCTSLSMSSRNMPRKARRTPAADVGLRWPLPLIERDHDGVAEDEPGRRTAPNLI